MPYKDPVKNAECKKRWEATPEAKATKKAYQIEYSKTPRYKYTHHRKDARKRGIEWLFTFDTWWNMWQSSGVWDHRGNQKGQFCMFWK